MVAARILRTAQLRAVEARFLPNADPPLMERAGAAAAEVAMRLAPSHASILIVAGPGNNGGDGFVVARLFKERGFHPYVVFCGKVDMLPADARSAFESWRAVGGTVHDELPTHSIVLAIDALFGIGLKRPLTGRHAELVAHLNSLDCPVLALDVPSGLDAETGRVLGCAVRATHTATFISLKPGLLTLDGPDHCGEIGIHDLGLDFSDEDGRTVTPEMFADHLAPRRRNSHKGSYGSATVIGGAPGMTGAALLAARAALKLGAGRVFVGTLERLPVDPVQPELMLRDAADALTNADALAIGPGLAQSEAAAELLRRAIACNVPLVLDADALNLLARHPVFEKQVATRQAPTLLTPHPTEAARLLGVDTATIQADRVESALRLAARTRALVALKGCGTVIAEPDGAWFINTNGNPGLATGGSGDALTGFVVALLAQGWTARAALLAAVHLHGAAADALVTNGDGPVGLAAGELADAARKLFNRWITREF